MAPERRDVIAARVLTSLDCGATVARTLQNAGVAAVAGTLVALVTTVFGTESDITLAQEAAKAPLVPKRSRAVTMALPISRTQGRRDNGPADCC